MSCSTCVSALRPKPTLLPLVPVVRVVFFFAWPFRKPRIEEVHDSPAKVTSVLTRLPHYTGLHEALLAVPNLPQTTPKRIQIASRGGWGNLHPIAHRFTVARHEALGVVSWVGLEAARGG